jgi:pimeloyl-ACP methyl ester carboxylesterase
MIGLLDAWGGARDLGRPRLGRAGRLGAGARYPERTAGVVGAQHALPAAPPKDPVAMMRERFGPAHYIVWFQTPRLPELAFEASLHRSFRFFMRRTDGHARSADERAKLSALKSAFEFFHPNPTHQLLTPEELEVYVAAYRRSGFRGPINWYRNLKDNWERSAALPDHVAAPALMITAELDPFLPPELSEGMERFVPDLERASVPGCGHWTQQENPEAVNGILLDWLGRRFPLGAPLGDEPETA